MKAVIGNLRAASMGKNFSTGTSPGTQTICQPVSFISFSFTRSKWGMPFS